MKLVVMGVLILINVILSGSVFSQIYMFGITPDILICFTASIIAIEKRVNGVIFAMAGALLMDMAYGPSIGFYTLQYFIAAIAMYYFASRMYTYNFYAASLLAAAGVVAKEIIAMMIVFFMGRPFSGMYVLVRYAIPAALTTGVLTLLTELMMKWLYRFKFMTRKATTEFLDNL